MTTNEKREFLKKTNHKAGVSSDDWDLVNENLVQICYFAAIWAISNCLEVTWTSIIRAKIKGVSVSDSHAQKRAADMRSKTWPHESKIKLQELINSTFQLGAISLRDGKEREVVYEESDDKKTEHFHLQVRF